MTLEKVRHMIEISMLKGMTPKTLLLTEKDARSLGIPNWTRQLMGMKVVIAGNIEESKVVPHFYESVRLKKGDINANNS